MPGDDRRRPGGPPRQGGYGGQQGGPRYCKGCAVEVPFGDYCDGCKGLAKRGRALLESEAYPEYFTGEDGLLKREMVGDWANAIALALALADDQVKLNKHQLRQFFNEVKLIWKAVQKESDYARMNARVGKVTGYANARHGRELIPALFRVFLSKNVARVQDKATLQAFAEHFEAVVAFCEGRIAKDKENR